jgi:hypothetical protein
VRVVPTYLNGDWTTTTFETDQEWLGFLLPLFKEPGKYEFDETSKIFNQEARKFNKEGIYLNAPNGGKDFRKYWDSEKAKCRLGVIYQNNDKTWYLTRDYYMWLNFLPIYDKEEKAYGFAKVRDAQYHMALYELIAELSNKHAAIFKKRQIASSYFHMGKLINTYWFEEGSSKGLKSKIQGASFEKNATTGVGGPTTYFFHEEAGIAPKMGDTYEYLRPAMSSGMITTGQFIAAGSVGDLDQCNPLKDMILNPTNNDIYAVETNLLDKDGAIGLSGLFIPEQWSMPPYIDQFGNSKVKEALEAIMIEREDWKNKLNPEQYQLRISQKPTNIAEGFAYRKESIFPQGIISKQLKKIEDKDYFYEHIELSRDQSGIVAKRSTKIPISTFPVDKKMSDKRGVPVVYERPIKNPPFGAYYASIDPVSEGKTTTSDSLCSIFVMKNAIEVTRETPDGPETFTERDKIVCAWSGRYDDINKTHEQLLLIIEWYNAWTVVENNISHFINYMVSKKKQKYLVPKSQMVFLKDLGSNKNVYQEYGWKNTGTLFKSHLISYAIEYLREEINNETDDDGNIISSTLGIERIPDPMLLTEMKQYQPGLNVDRLVAFSALVAFAKVQEANRGYLKVKEESSSLDKSKKMYKLKYSPFRNMGSKKSMSGRKRRSGFKNLK